MTDNLQDIYTLQIRRQGNPNSASPYCEACKNGFLHVNSLQVRQFTQTGKLPGVCKSCNIAFLKICRLQIRHLTQNEHQPHVCSKCNKSFTHAGNYKKHMLLHEREAENPGSVNGFKSSNHPKPPFKCEKCDRNFLKYGSFVKHCVNHDTKYTCEVCEKVFKTKQLLKGHMFSHRIEQHCYACKLCKQTFNVPGKLEEHLLKHMEEQSNSSQGIDMEETQNPESLPMQAQVDEAEDQVPETESEEVCTTTTELDSEQVEFTPDDSDRFKHYCSICSKGFVNLGTLKNHFSKHTGDLRFKCKKCGRKFVHAFNLRKHAATHLKYRYCCKVCNKVFRSSKLFKAHSFTHTKRK